MNQDTTAAPSAGGKTITSFRRWSTIDAPSSSSFGVGLNHTVKSAVHETEVEAALHSHQSTLSHQYDMERLQRHATATVSGLSTYEDCLRASLCQAVFVGHVNTDLDSVAGAIGAAQLFGGVAALAEPLNQLNGEILFALKNSGVQPPPFFDDLQQSAHCKVCLVDHTEEKQMVPSLRNSDKLYQRIIGVVDHHALAKSFRTVKPIYMDLRPWGSMSTIVGYLFIAHRRSLPKPIAILLLQAILSDTLNLRSVTTTDADRAMVALLVSFAGIGNLNRQQPSTTTTVVGAYQDSDIDRLAKKQFQAKTNWVVSLGPYEMTRGDQKDFTCGPWKFGISVLEVTDTTAVLSVAKEILLELRLLKKEKGLVDIHQGSSSDGGKTLDVRLELDFAFLFVVNVVEETSTLLICGGRELALAKAAFLENDEINPDGTSVVLQEALPGIVPPGSTILPHETAMTLPKGYVSRKAQFVPAFFQAIQDDFEYESKGPVSESVVAEECDDTEDAAGEQDDAVAELQAKLQLSKRTQKPRRRRTSLMRSFNTNAMNMLIAQEELVAEELVQANKIPKDGNLYDDLGRVVRSYAVAD